MVYNGSMSFFGAFFGQLALVWAFVANTWWLWTPPLLFYAAFELWKFYLKTRYFAALQWILLEVRIPREIAKTPEAMEQIFAGLQTMYFPFDPWEKYWLGLQHDYIVFEMASMGGETRFYVRAPVFFKNVVEAQIYAQYPEAEIVEAEDYMKQLPGAVPNGEWNLFGVEFKLAKADAYPIRTYGDYTNLAAGQEEFEKVDPFSSLAELMSRLRPGEHLGYHLLIQPAQDDGWKKEGEALIGKLLGRKISAPKGKFGAFSGELNAIGDQFVGAVEKIVTGIPPGEAAKPEKEERLPFVPPDVDEAVKAITRNITKPGWRAVVRMIYVARRDMFHLSHFASFIGAMKQYNTLTLNAFTLNSRTLSGSVPWWLPEFLTNRRKFRKQNTYYNYYRARKPFVDTRFLRSKVITLNTEELATIYHYPGMTAKAPFLPRIEAKRSEPPAALPVG